MKDDPAQKKVEIRNDSEEYQAVLSWLLEDKQAAEVVHDGKKSSSTAGNGDDFGTVLSWFREDSETEDSASSADAEGGGEKEARSSAHPVKTSPPSLKPIDEEDDIICFKSDTSAASKNGGAAENDQGDTSRDFALAAAPALAPGWSFYSHKPNFDAAAESTQKNTSCTQPQVDPNDGNTSDTPIAASASASSLSCSEHSDEEDFHPSKHPQQARKPTLKENDEDFSSVLSWFREDSEAEDSATCTGSAADDTSCTSGAEGGGEGKGRSLSHPVTTCLPVSPLLEPINEEICYGNSNANASGATTSLKDGSAESDQSRVNLALAVAASQYSPSYYSLKQSSDVAAEDTQKADTSNYTQPGATHIAPPHLLNPSCDDGNTSDTPTAASTSASVSSLSCSEDNNSEDLRKKRCLSTGASSSSQSDGAIAPPTASRTPPQGHRSTSQKSSDTNVEMEMGFFSTLEKKDIYYEAKQGPELGMGFFTQQHQLEEVQQGPTPGMGFFSQHAHQATDDEGAAKRRKLEAAASSGMGERLAPLYMWAPELDEFKQNCLEYTLPITLPLMSYFFGYSAYGVAFCVLTVIVHTIETALTNFGPMTASFRLRFAPLKPVQHMLIDCVIIYSHVISMLIWPQHFGPQPHRLSFALSLTVPYYVAVSYKTHVCKDERITKGGRPAHTPVEAPISDSLKDAKLKAC